MIRGSAKHRGYDRAADNGSDDDGGTGLGVLAKSPNTEGEDRREANGLEEEDEVEAGEARVLACTNRRCLEDDYPCEEAQEDPARLGELHEECPEEAACGETALRACEEVCTLGGGGVTTGFGYVVYEIAGDGDCFVGSVSRIFSGCGDGMKWGRDYLGSRRSRIERQRPTKGDIDSSMVHSLSL